MTHFYSSLISHGFIFFFFIIPMLMPHGCCFIETAERDFGELPPEEGGRRQKYLQRQRQDEYHKGTFQRDGGT